MGLLKPLFTTEMVDLFPFVLSFSYFLYNDDCYQQLDGVAMGSPLSLAATDLSMGFFEQRVLEWAPLNPSVFFRYVDDTFII